MSKAWPTKTRIPQKFHQDLGRALREFASDLPAFKCQGMFRDIRRVRSLQWL